MIGFVIDLIINIHSQEVLDFVFLNNLETSLVDQVMQNLANLGICRCCHNGVISVEQVDYSALLEHILIHIAGYKFNRLQFLN